MVCGFHMTKMIIDYKVSPNVLVVAGQRLSYVCLNIWLILALVGCLSNVGVERRSSFIRGRDVEVSQLVSRGVAELQQGRHWGAVESFEKALVLAPRSAPIINNLVVALMKVEAFSEAAAKVKELELLEGESTKSVFIRGDIAFATGDLEAAARLYRRSVELSEEAVGLGGILAQKDNTNYKPSNFSEQAKRSEVYKRLIEVKIKQGKDEEALCLMQDADYQSLAKAEMNDREIVKAALYAKVALGSGRLREARTVLEHIFEAGNKESELVKLAAVADYYLGDRIKFARMIIHLIDSEDLDEDQLKEFNEGIGNDLKEIVTEMPVTVPAIGFLDTIRQFSTMENTELSGPEDFKAAANVIVRYLVSSMPVTSQVYLPPQAVVQFGAMIRSRYPAEPAA